MRQPAWRRYLRLWGPDVRRDVDDEFDFHIATRAEEYVKQGMSVADARRRAVAEFGDMSGAKQLCRDIGEHQLRRRHWSELGDTLAQDARYALRMLRRSPAFSVVATLTLALGIGGTTAIFSVVHGVLLRALPFAQPEALVRIWETTPQGADRNVIASGNFLAWRAGARSFSAMGAHRAPYGVAFTGDGDPVQITVTDIEPEVLSILGVQPLVGRWFSPADGAARARLVMLGYELWQQRYGGDRNVIGRQMVLDDVTYEIVGIMPRGFVFPDATAKLWRLVRHGDLDPEEHRSHNWYAIGRLRPGQTIAGANAELRTIASRLSAEFPQFNAGFGVNVVPMHGDLVASVRPLLVVLLAGALIVLVVACANIANLLLARALAREREIAVRGALGAERARLVRQLLTESLVLAAVGGAFGVLLANAILRALLAIAPPDVPLLESVRIALPVLAFAGATTVLSALLFGMVPVLRLARTDLQSTLRAANDRTGSVRHARMRGALLVGEVALSLVLLVGAGLLLRSAQRLRAVDFGYRTDRLLAVSLTLPYHRYDTTTKHLAFYEPLIEQVREIPGVAAVTGTTKPPGLGYSMTFGFVIEGRPSANARGREDPRQLDCVTPGFFRMMGMPLVAGREFEDTDRSGSTPVVVLNQTLARRYWPNGDAIGRKISLIGHEGPWLQIVGVVRDARFQSADLPPEPVIYLPYAQRRDNWRWLSWLTLMVRVNAGVDPHSLDGAIRAAVARLDPRIPVQRSATVEELYGESIARRKFATLLVGGFAAIALVIGVVGMYGVLSYTVAQRRREIGIRLALGASSRRVIGAVLAQASALALSGVLIGGVAALALTRWLRSLLYEVSTTDPLTFVGVGGLVMLVACMAAWLPARRATRVDPLTVIREA